METNNEFTYLKYLSKVYLGKWKYWFFGASATMQVISDNNCIESYHMIVKKNYSIGKYASLDSFINQGMKNILEISKNHVELNENLITEIYYPKSILIKSMTYINSNGEIKEKTINNEKRYFVNSFKYKNEKINNERINNLINFKTKILDQHEYEDLDLEQFTKKFISLHEIKVEGGNVICDCSSNLITIILIIIKRLFQKWKSMFALSHD